MARDVTTDESPDRATVPLQDGVVATRCPVRADLDHVPHMASRRLPTSVAVQERSDAAADFRAEVLARVAGAMADGARAVVPAGDRRTAQDATVAALRGGAQVVTGAWLPDDPAGRRTGRPDLLVRLGAGWVPVLIRRHLLTRPHQPTATLAWSPVEHLDPLAPQQADGVQFRNGPLGTDGLQLAHHWRMLEALGLVDPVRQPAGGLVDRSGACWWIDLAAPRWTTWWSPVDRVSTLARYDRAFGLRLDVIARRLAREQGQALDPLVVPVWIGECRDCPWQGVCGPELEAQDHVSLLPGSSFGRFAAHRDRGVLTRAQVATLDWPTAALLHGTEPRSPTVDAAAVLAAAEGHHPSVLLSDVLPAPAPAAAPEVDRVADERTDDADEERPPDPFRVARARLEELGVATVGDLARLDEVTLRYQGTDVGHLPSLIDQARAVTAGRPFRARSVGRIDVPRADVEVDVDMENVDGGVYLWGTFTTVGSVAAERLQVRPGYRPFLTWAPMTPEDGPAAAAEVFVDFWTWLAALRRLSHEAGLTFAAYCYTAIEAQKMRQLATAQPNGAAPATEAEVDELTTSPDWVDLYEVVRRSLVTGGGMGLKKVALLAGFAWRDADPGGEQSMAWHRLATTGPDPAVRAVNRARLLAYNEDDVRATLAVRDWLAAADLPAIESWRPPSTAPPS